MSLGKFQFSPSRFLRRFAAARDGVVAIILGIALLPTILLGGAAIDMHRVSGAKSTVQAAADSAALAAANALRQGGDAWQARWVATNYVRAALEGANIFLRSDVPVRVNARTVTVIIEASVPMTLMKIARINNVDINADATATYRAVETETPLEVALALDTTGSMAASGKLETLKVAAKDLVDTLMNPETVGARNVRVGVVPLAEHVNLGATYRGADWLNDSEPSKPWTTGCIRSQAEPYDYGAVADASKPVPLIYDPPPTFYPPGQGYLPPDPSCPPTPLMRLGQNQRDVVAAIDSLVADGRTYIPPGSFVGLASARAGLSLSRRVALRQQGGGPDDRRR